MARLPAILGAAALAAACLSLGTAVAPPARAAHARAHRSALCANADTRPRASRLNLLRTATRCLVNRERVAHGERPLASSPSLARAAQSHTESMVARRYFDHIGPAGDTPLMRIRAAGYMAASPLSGYARVSVGENLAWGTGRLSTPRAIVAAWMASPGHRANILDPLYRATAIGISTRVPSSLAHGHAGGIYTEDFGSIR